MKPGVLCRIFTLARLFFGRRCCFALPSRLWRLQERMVLPLLRVRGHSAHAGHGRHRAALLWTWLLRPALLHLRGPDGMYMDPANRAQGPLPPLIRVNVMCTRLHPVRPVVQVVRAIHRAGRAIINVTCYSP